MNPQEQAEQMKELVDRFLSWPLPTTVCSDACASIQSYPHRSGTTLLTADEAKQMLEHVVGGVLDKITSLQSENARLREAANKIIKSGSYFNDATYMTNLQMRNELARALSQGAVERCCQHGIHGTDCWTCNPSDAGEKEGQ